MPYYSMTTPHGNMVYVTTLPLEDTKVPTKSWRKHQILQWLDGKVLPSHLSNPDKEDLPHYTCAELLGFCKFSVLKRLIVVKVQCTITKKRFGPAYKFVMDPVTLEFLDQ